MSNETKQQSTFQKAWAALSIPQRKSITRWFFGIVSAVVLLMAYAFGTLVGHVTTDVPTVLRGEIQAHVVGEGDNFFVITNLENSPNSEKWADVMSTKPTQLTSNWSISLYAQVTGYCEDLRLEIAFWAGDRNSEARQLICAKPDTYIAVAPQGNSYWDGWNVNGFTQSDNWELFVVPAYFAPPQPTAEPMNTATEPTE